MDVQLMEQYKSSIAKTKRWCLENIDIEGNLKGNVEDLQAYFALPYLLCNLGLKEEAYRVTVYLLHSYSTHDGGLRGKRTDSTSQPLQENITEVMSWIGIAAQNLGRFEISFPFSRYLRSYYDPEQGAFTALAPYGRIEAVLDLFSSTMLGWFALYTGDLKKAQRAGNFLQRCISLQTTKESVFYLRLEQDGRLITSFPKGQDKYYLVSPQSLDQNLQFLALPVIFLGKLYQGTQQETYLRTAQSYFETLIHYDTQEAALTGWSAAILANITKEARYMEKAKKVGDSLLSSQAEEGFWSQSNAVRQYYKTAMNAISLSEITMELSVT